MNLSFKSSKIIWALVAGLVLTVGIRSSRVMRSDGNISLAGFKLPQGGPVAEVHPEVLNLQASFSRVAELVKPSVVSISTIHHIQPQAQRGGPEFYFGDPFEEFFQHFFNAPGGPGPNPRMQRSPRQQRPRPQPFKSEGVGSGVIIEADGLVLTNEHVVRDADQIKVTVYDKGGEKKEYTGRVVGKDARTDLAVVRINAGRKLPFAALGDSSKVKVGDWAVAIGSPFNLAQTVTVGVISADRQSLVIEGREYHNLIQTDASINRGNSGGPLLNIKGEVVGINTAIYAPTGVFAGIGFAVPINQAKAILKDLVNKGHVVRGWLGVELAREITPAMVKSFGLPDAQGALVNDVMKGSPAEKAGLKRGDIIRSFKGEPVPSSDALQNMVAQTPPKKAVPIEVLRGREKLNLKLVLGERPESADTGQREGPAGQPKKDHTTEKKEWWGAKVMTYSADLAETYMQPKDIEGVLVIELEPGTDADQMGLAPGDIIRGVNQTTTPNVSAFAKATDKLKPEQGIVLDIVRQGRPIFLSFMKE